MANLLRSDATSNRVCVVVGGGDAPGVNAILRAFVHAAYRLGVAVSGCRDGFEGLLDPRARSPLSIRDVQGLLPRGGCFLGCSTRVNPFYVSEPGASSPRDMGPVIIERLRAEGIGALVLVGGDGTMVAARRFAALGMPTLGIPKTIDNDLGGTDVTCGFDTAVGTATHAVDALHSTAEAHARIMVVEVMGRYAGFLALHAAVAGGADIVLIPEIPYDIDRVARRIRERERLGLRFSIVVVAEGARPASGGEVAAIEAARPGHLPRLGGAGARLARDLEMLNLGHEVRLTVLGHTQRGGSPSAFDRGLATQLGTRAAELCAEQCFNRMLCWRDGMVTSMAFPDEQAMHRRVDPRGPLAKSARLVGVELGGDP